MSDPRPPTYSHRRGLLLAVAGCLAGAAVLLLASGRAWLQVGLPAQPPLPGVSQTLSGGEVIDALVPIGILVGAAGLALIAARWLGRLVVGVVLVAVGLLILAGVGFFLYDGGWQTAWSWGQAYATAGSSVFPEHDMSPAPAVAAMFGGAIAVAVGTFTTVRCGRWPVMGARYERRTRSLSRDTRAAPAGTGSTPQVDTAPEASEAAMWAAMDRGEDPTARPIRSPSD